MTPKNHTPFRPFVLGFAVALVLTLGTSAVGLAAPLPTELTLPSLEGTQADGQLALDADGQLVIDPQLRLFFDWALSARGEVDDARLRARVAYEADSRVPNRAAQQAVELFDRYLRYMDEAEARIGHTSDVATAYRERMAARAEILGAETARALFGNDLGMEKAALQFQARLVDAQTPAEKEAARRAWEASLPADERLARTEATKPLRVEAEVAALRAAGATDEATWSARARAFGPEAAERLAELDRQRQRWHERVARFQAERLALEADADLDDEARRAAVEALVEASFDEREQLRLRALETR